jgi:hypothetical protein
VKPRTVGCYGFVNRPYDGVRSLLLRDPVALLHRATTSASARARSIVVSLEIGVAELHVDVTVQVRRAVEEAGEEGTPRLRIEFVWEPAHHATVLPSMSATLMAWPFSAAETQLELEGAYHVPMGPLGSVFDAAIGHRIAQATMLRFLDDVQEQLLDELQPTA